MRYAFADCVLDTQLYTLIRAGTPRPLRPKVFQVLAYLLAHHDRVVSKEELLEHLWPGQFVGDVGLNSYIMAVRKALGDRRPPYQYVRTVRGHGYRFVGVVAVEGLAASAAPLQEGPSLVAAGPEDDPPRPPVWSSLARAAGISPPATVQTAPPSAGPSVPELASLGGVPRPGTPDAERRQLTVLCCDLVDATCSPVSSIRKTCGRWCVPTIRPALR